VNMTKDRPPVGSTKIYFPSPVHLDRLTRRGRTSKIGAVMTREQFYAAPYAENTATWERLIDVAHDAREESPSQALEQAVVETKINLELDALLASRALANRLAEILHDRDETNTD
jgi:hypothetical protein